jgi:hypothetical protein
VVSLDQAFDDRQAEAGAAPMVRSLSVPFEHERDLAARSEVERR